MTMTNKNPLIYIYVDGIYQHSTKWSKNCHEAIKTFEKSNPSIIRAGREITAKQPKK